MDNTFGTEYSDTPLYFGTSGDTLVYHRLLTEAALHNWLVSTRQLAELTDIKYESCNAKPDTWSKWGFVFNKVKLEEGGLLWSIKKVVLTDG